MDAQRFWLELTGWKKEILARREASAQVLSK
jgi:hypothetical protein